MLCILGLLWFVLAESLAGRAARGIADRFDLAAARPPLAAVFLLFLLAVGYSVLGRVSRAGRGGLREALSLPQRPTSGREWVIGAAIGWGMAIAAVLPMALARTLHVSFWTSSRAAELLAVSLATLLLSTLAVEVALRGYPFQRLIAAVGPTGATVVFVLVLAAEHQFTGETTWISIGATLLMSLLLSLAWLRTHALWLPWGLHFAWNAGVGVFFGLPLRGNMAMATVVETRAIGHTWLTGGDFGPEGALLTLFVLLTAVILLVRATDDYAWAYTRPEIVAAGYEVNPPPPLADAAMENDAIVRAPALVQILPTTPQSPVAKDT